MMLQSVTLAQPQLDELRPHLPQFDGLVVKGEGLERRIVAELQQARAAAARDRNRELVLISATGEE
jgi:hypothetical protein